MCGRGRTPVEKMVEKPAPERVVVTMTRTRLDRPTTTHGVAFPQVRALEPVVATADPAAATFGDLWDVGFAQASVRATGAMVRAANGLIG